MRLMNGGLMAALMAGAVVGVAGCSSDGDDDRRSRRDPVYRNDGDYRSQREKLDRAQGDYADRDRDGIRDGVEDATVTACATVTKTTAAAGGPTPTCIVDPLDDAEGRLARASTLVLGT